MITNFLAWPLPWKAESCLVNCHRLRGSPLFLSQLFPRSVFCDCKLRYSVDSNLCMAAQQFRSNHLLLVGEGVIDSTTMLAPSTDCLLSSLKTKHDNYSAPIGIDKHLQE